MTTELWCNIDVAQLSTIRFAQLFAETNQANITLLHVSDRACPKEEIYAFEQPLQAIVEEQIQPQLTIEIKILLGDDVTEAIIAQANDYDMVVLRSMRRRTAGGLAVSDVTHRAIKDLKCSVVLFGEPTNSNQ